MGGNFGGFHVLSIVILCLTLFVLPFLTDNPVLLAGLLIFIISVFAALRSFKNLKKYSRIFVPLFLLTFLINVLFAQEGMTVLFRVLGKNFTLEAVVYSVLLSLKLLLVIYIFMLAGMMVDSDKAAAYFSSIAPKSTLMLMVGIKLLPNMRIRFKNLMEVYSIRGVDFEGKGLRNRVNSLIPVLSILLEDSLEGAFDIGEAVYVRGFLSGKRSVYDRQPWKIRDYVLIASCILSAAAFIILKALGLINFDAYMGLSLNNLLNTWVFAAFLLLMAGALAMFFIGEN